MATDIEKLFVEITNGLNLLKPQQVEIVAAHFYRQQVQALTKEALEDFKEIWRDEDYKGDGGDVFVMGW